MWLSDSVSAGASWMLSSLILLVGSLLDTVRSRSQGILKCFQSWESCLCCCLSRQWKALTPSAVHCLWPLAYPLLWGVKLTLFLLYVPWTFLLSPAMEWLVSRLAWRRRDSDRREQEKRERARAEGVARAFARKNGYKNFRVLQDLGSRLQKFWYSVEGESGRALVLTVAPVSTNCPVVLSKSQDAITKFLQSVEHPFLQVIEKLEYMEESGYLVIIQPLMSEAGSLKDLIYKVRSPTLDWSAKYASSCEDPLGAVARTDAEKERKIACYGRQILEATLYLYSTGLQPMGHIHSGNIYVDLERDVCLLGGYENRLLGYRTRLYSLCREHNYSEDIDIIMIGCLLFEMACGYELTTLVPEPEDYTAIQSQAIKDLLLFIFRRDKQGNFLATVEQIAALDFFQEASPPSLEGVAEGEWPQVIPPSLSRDVRHLVSKVMKGKPRLQTPKAAAKRSCKIQ